MMIKAYRIQNYPLLGMAEPMDMSDFYPSPIQFHTGTYDRNGNMIFEGDTLLSMTCEIPFKVENIVDFLMMCGEYRAKNGVEIFPSLEIVDENV